MRVADIVDSIPGAAVLAGSRDLGLLGVAFDSRRVAPGDAFFALRGERVDGHDYLHQAMAAGAVALVVDRQLALPPGATAVLVPDTRLALAHAAAINYHHPSRRLQLVGVTGTKGKTTTTHLVRAVLQAAGHQTGLIGTIHNIVGGRAEAVTHTTPEAPDLQLLFRRMVDSGDRAVAMEVSSHALAQSRVACSEYDVAALTNLGHDHLDFHRTQEQYVAAKARLFAFKSLRAAVLNASDPSSERMREQLASGVSEWTYALGAAQRASRLHVQAGRVRLLPSRVEFEVQTPQGCETIDLGLPGRFNVQNALCALTIGLACGISLAACCRGLSSVRGVPGRFERVPAGQPFEVIVDYAHTPESLANVLETAREFTAGKLIAVFGCGGDRDRTRRPTMGRVASSLADYVVVTSDNPRSEDPEAIIHDIVVGMPQQAGASRRTWESIADRAAAIGAAVGMAAPSDVVVICGKGHETYQIIGDRVVHFDDREVVRAVLQRLGYGEAE